MYTETQQNFRKAAILQFHYNLNDHEGDSANQQMSKRYKAQATSK